VSVVNKTEVALSELSGSARLTQVQDSVHTCMKSHVLPRSVSMGILEICVETCLD
jgi:hypothetical protein